MSRAFTKEGEGPDELPERPVSDRPNYVTPAGHRDLLRRRDALIERRSELARAPGAADKPEFRLIERDLRYYEARLQSAVVVDRSKDKPADVRFGARVEVEEDGRSRRYAIVGEDEADPENGKLSWSSPLAMALIGAKPGDEVSWESPDGPRAARLLSLEY